MEDLLTMPYSIDYYYEQIGSLYRGNYAGRDSIILIKDVIDRGEYNGYHFLYEVYNPPTGSGGTIESTQQCALFLDNCKKIS